MTKLDIREKLDNDTLTYGNLYTIFCKQHPELQVDDYRPAGRHMLYVWYKDHTETVWQLNEDTLEMLQRTSVCTFAEMLNGEYAS